MARQLVVVGGDSDGNDSLATTGDRAVAVRYPRYDDSTSVAIVKLEIPTKANEFLPKRNGNFFDFAAETRSERQ